MKIDEIMSGLKNAGYYADTKTAFGVSAALNGIPMIITGAPGAGKTSLAYAVSKMMGMPLERVQCYDGLTASDILYDYNYQLQLLTLEASKSFIEKEYGREENIKNVIDKIANSTNFFGKNFLIERPILRTISGNGRRVLLIDEVDKTDEPTEYLLLEILSEFAITIPQYGTVKCPDDEIPIVFLTSNESRDLSDALKRRCGFLHIKEKTKEEMTEIIVAKASVNKDLALKIASCIAEAQKMSLIQTPSIAEGIQWANFLQENYSREAAEGSLGLLAKTVRDEELLLPVVSKIFGVVSNRL